MPWEDIGSVGTGELPQDREWIAFCFELAKEYVTFVAGKPPAHCKIEIMGHDHESGDYPSLGLCTEEFGVELDIDYVVACQNALAVLDDAVDWGRLKEHWEETQESNEVDEEEDEADADERGCLTSVSDTTVSREDAKKLAVADALAHDLGSSVRSIHLLDEITWRKPLPFGADPADLANSWIAYIEQSGSPALRASTIVVIDGETGKVLYRGSANDAG